MVVGTVDVRFEEKQAERLIRYAVNCLVRRLKEENLIVANNDVSKFAYEEAIASMANSRPEEDISNGNHED